MVNDTPDIKLERRGKHYLANRERKLSQAKAWREANRERYRELQRAWREANRERCAELAREWRISNPERSRELSKEFRERNRDKISARGKAYRQRLRDVDPDGYRAKCTKKMRKQRCENPGHYNAVRARRRAARLQATPPWADQEAIRAVYDLAAFMGLTVDHIHPLQGKNFCGLHVPWNLQLLTAKDNAAKGNRLTNPLCADQASSVFD